MFGEARGLWLRSRGPGDELLEDAEELRLEVLRRLGDGVSASSSMVLHGTKLVLKRMMDMGCATLEVSFAKFPVTAKARRTCPAAQIDRRFYRE